MRSGPPVLMVAAVLGLAGCARGRDITFNPVPTAPATRPVAPLSAPPSQSGTTRVKVTGAITVSTRDDFFCTIGYDDHFVRGAIPLADGTPLHVSVEIDTRPPPKPGTYRGTVRILVRKVIGEYYASWYHDTATMTVLPDDRGADLPRTVLRPEAGTSAAGEIEIGGHFGCAAQTVRR